MSHTTTNHHTKDMPRSSPRVASWRRATRKKSPRRYRASPNYDVADTFVEASRVQLQTVFIPEEGFKKDVEVSLFPGEIVDYVVEDDPKVRFFRKIDFGKSSVSHLGPYTHVLLTVYSDGQSIVKLAHDLRFKVTHKSGSGSVEAKFLTM